MRKILASAVLAAVALTLTPSHAASQSGTVALPTANVSRAQRCATSLGLGNGLVGWVVNVTPGAAFTLKATGDTAAAQDLDIAFYKTLTACEADANSVASQHVSVIGNEAGTVPADAGKGIVWLKAGANASFTFDN